MRAMKLQILCLCVYAAFANVSCHDNHSIKNGNHTATAAVRESKTAKRGINHYNPSGWGGHGVGTYGVPTTPVYGYGGGSAQGNVGVPVQGYGIPVQGYGVSVQGYGIPVQGYGVSVQGYGIPVQGYGVSVVQADRPVPYPVPYDRPVPYPVGYDRPVPYPVGYDRPVPYPVRVDRPLPYPVHVDRPLPYPVQVEKPVPYPVHVDRPVPYPVQVDKPQPYPVHVDRPYPVHVDRPVPYPVHVPYKVSVPVDRPYPVKVPVPSPYPVDRPVPYAVQVPIKVPVVQHVPYEVARPYPVVITKQVVQPQPVLWQAPTASAYPLYVAQQPIAWQQRSTNVDNNYSYVGTPAYNGGNQAGYQFSPYPTGYSIGVNHALVGLGAGSRGGQGVGTNTNSAVGGLLGSAFNVMQGLMSPGGSIAGYATGHNNYLGPRTTGLTTNINK